MAAAGWLCDRAGARLRLSGRLTTVALAGPTGGGKSSLFNALARMELSPAGYLRPTTDHAHACVWGDEDAGELLDWLGVTDRFARESPLDAQDEAGLHGLVLLDLPDLDTVAAGHRVEARRLVGVVDLVVWVLDPQKYADQSVHEGYLRHLDALRDVTVVVFNQVDRLSAADVARCQVDLDHLLEVDGLAGVPIITTSARTGAGVDELRTLLEKTVAAQHGVPARLEGELDHAVGQLAELVRPKAPLPAEPVSRQAVQELGDELARAAGVPAVVAQAGRGYRRRAALPGWPWTRISTVDASVPPADPAAVGSAVRRLGATASAGLPSPWPDDVQGVLSRRSDELVLQLDQALRRAVRRPPRATGWIAARVVWWLAVAAVLTGGAGLIGYAGQGEAFGAGLGLHDVVLAGGVLPGPIVVPTLLLVAGAVVAVALPPLGWLVAAVRARRYAERVEARLFAAATSVAREAVAPARQVLRDYDEASAALWAAAGRVDRWRPG